MCSSDLLGVVDGMDEVELGKIGCRAGHGGSPGGAGLLTNVCSQPIVLQVCQFFQCEFVARRLMRAARLDVPNQRGEILQRADELGLRNVEAVASIDVGDQICGGDRRQVAGVEHVES